MLMLPMQHAHIRASVHLLNQAISLEGTRMENREGGRRLAWLTAVAICVDIHNKAHQSSSEAAHSLD